MRSEEGKWMEVQIKGKLLTHSEDISYGKAVTGFGAIE